MRSVPAFVESFETNSQVLSGTINTAARSLGHSVGATTNTATGSTAPHPAFGPPQTTGQQPPAGQQSTPFNTGNGSSHPPLMNMQSGRPHRSDPRYVYMCIEKSGSYHFAALRSDRMKADVEFFSGLKAEYLKVRGLVRKWFSMWRYNHCEFFRVSSSCLSSSETADV